MSVVRFKDIFSTFVDAEQSAHTYGKCFLKSLYESVVVFKAEGHTDSTHSWYILLSKGVLCVPMSHIIPSVGHWDVYFCLGLTTTFIQVNGIRLTLFFLITSL